MNEKTRQVFDANDIIKKVGDLPEYLQFINNACLVEFIKQSYKDARKYDSFFLKKEDGKVEELWGVFDRYPYSTTYAYRIIQTCK
jgi:thioredoxin-related protein